MEDDFEISEYFEKVNLVVFKIMLQQKWFYLLWEIFIFGVENPRSCEDEYFF